MTEPYQDTSSAEQTHDPQVTPADAQQQQDTSSAEQTHDPQVTPADAQQQQPAGASVPEVAPGVPFFQLENPFGGFGVGVLVGYDPEARHEQGQPAESPATDQAAPRKWDASGGSAYYMDLMTGKGWSVPLGKVGE